MFKKLPHGQSFHIAWPMILSNMSVPLMGMADTAMLGHLAESSFLAGATLGTNVVALCYWMFTFLRMSTTSATAQAEGSGNTSDALQQMSISIGFGLCGGVLLIALQNLLLPTVMGLMTSDQSLFSLAMSYCQVRIFSAPAVLVTYVAMGWLIGRQKTRTALVVTVLSNLLNIVLDYIFIVVMQWDVKGAATATLIAEFFACALALISIGRTLHSEGKLHALIPQLSFARMLSTMQVNADLFLRTLAILFTFNFFHAQGARFGDDILAANAILMQWILFTSFFLDGYAHAAETLTANAIGARDEKRFHRASFAALVASLGIACCLTIVYIFGRDLLLPLFTDIPEVRQYVNEFSIWLLLMPLVSVWCYAFDGIFIGAGKTRVMRNHMAMALFIIFLPLWWTLQPMHNHGLWIAFVVFNGFRGFSLGCAYWFISRRHGWYNSY